MFSVHVLRTRKSSPERYSQREVVLAPSSSHASMLIDIDKPPDVDCVPDAPYVPVLVQSLFSELH